jgi:hypothetical protein
MRTVFVVFRRKKSDGSGGLVGEFDTEAEAVASAAKQPAHFNGGWVLVSPLTWENGDDVITVETREEPSSP